MEAKIITGLDGIDRRIAYDAQGERILCEVCGKPPTQCRAQLGLESSATHAAIRVVPEPIPTSLFE
jgi:hypothetical protein